MPCRMSSAYELLRKMRFFKHFFLCRAFRVWHRSIRRQVRGAERSGR